MRGFLLDLASMRNLGYRRCFLIYLIAFGVVFSGLFSGKNVISPVCQTETFGASGTGPASCSENPKFRDYVAYYVPEATVFLRGRRSGWIATWTPLSELGRPTTHLAGLSPAYFPNWIISKFTSDGFRYITTIAVLTMFLAGAFTFLLAWELSLVPAAALVAALAVGLSPGLIFWQTFPMFAASFGWTAATLYGLTRFVRRRDLLGWVTIAFAIYSLLLTAYPVMVIYHAYLCAGFAIYLLRRRTASVDQYSLLSIALGVTSAAMIGVLAALPPLLDTYQAMEHSARAHPDVEFLRAVIQPLKTLKDWIRFLGFWTFPQVMGNPISTSFPSQFIGWNLAPFAVFLICISNWRRTWGWWAFILALVAIEALPPVFSFVVHYLGVGLSRTVPTVIATLPLAMIAAANVHSVCTEWGLPTSGSTRTTGRELTRLAVPVLLYLVLLVVAAKAASLYGVSISYTALFAFMVYLPGLVIAIKNRLPGIIVVIAIGHLLMFDRQMLLVQPRSAIVQSTPVTRRMQTLLAHGGRFASLQTATDFAPPNMNVQVMLPSVHSYDSLSPVSYQQLIYRLGGHVMNLGRYSVSMDASSIGSVDFRLADIRVVLARQPIVSKDVVLDSDFEGLLVYRVIDNWGGYVRADANSFALGNGENAGAKLTDVDHLERQAATIIANQGDRLDLRLARVDNSTTLLVASQLYNANWHAEGLTTQGWRKLSALPVNGTYEGIVIPGGVDTVRLRFIPWVRWSWLGHVAFSLLGVCLLVVAFRQRRAGAKTTCGTYEHSGRSRSPTSSRL
jgi:hypothetical protein